MGKDAAARAVLDRAKTAKPPSGQLQVLKYDDLFAVFDARGDFHGALHAVGPICLIAYLPGFAARCSTLRFV